MSESIKQKGSGERAWYAIHTYAGYENAVLRNLQQRIESLNMEDKIFNCVVPTEKTVTIKNGKRVEQDEKIYPGYVLVEMIVTDESWFVIRNTPRVTGFVGSGVVPVPLSQKEIDELFGRMQADTTKHSTEFEMGESVSIMDGPFKDMEGAIEEINAETGKIKVVVAMFGRDVPVELDSLQIKKL